jgi:hypothetical protein
MKNLLLKEQKNSLPLGENPVFWGFKKNGL